MMSTAKADSTKVTDTQSSADHNISSIAQRKKELVLAGPGTLVSYPLFRMIESGALSPYAENVSFRHWQTPDQMRAMVVSQQVDVTSIPTNVAAMFYNKGQKVRLLNVSVWGLLWLISREEHFNKLEDFTNENLMVPFRNDMPDLMFRALSEGQDIDPDKQFNLHYAASGMNAMQMLLAGKINHAILPEPAVSILLMRNKKKGQHPLYRAIDLSKLWQQTFPQTPRIPQAGIMSTASLEADPALRQAISQAYQQASQWCQSHIQDCAQLAHQYLPHIPVPAAVQALKHSPLNGQTASAVSDDLQAFFQKIHQLDARKIGGRLPDQEFYQP